MVTGAGISANLRQAALAFRLGQEATGCERLTGFIDGLLPTLGNASPDLVHQLERVLGEALQAQQRKDFILVADLLEYELAPLLGMESPQD